MQNWRNISNLYDATVFDLTEDWDFLKSLGVYEEDKNIVVNELKESSYRRYVYMYSYAQYTKDKDLMKALDKAYPDEVKWKETLYNE